VEEAWSDDVERWSEDFAEDSSRFLLQKPYLTLSNNEHPRGCDLLPLTFNLSMAWHSKWANIKHRKAAEDAKKSQYYAKVGKLIQIAARQWPNPAMNPALATVLLKAKQYNLPKDVVQRAIEKGSGTGEGSNLEVIFYEWYAPGGIAVYIKCVTDNTNRSAANTKTLLSKYGGARWEPGSVARQFAEKGEIIITGIKTSKIEKWKTVEEVRLFDTQELEMQLLECDIEDYEIDTDLCKVITSRDSLITVTGVLEFAWYAIESSELVYVPSNTIELDDEGREKLERIIDVLEADDDVDTVYHNAG
jgi:YebC/PmpR family DNA-binding regulatory protein